MPRKTENTPPAPSPSLTIDKRAIFYLLIIAGIYWIASLYREAVSSLIVGMLLAYLLHPIVRFLKNKLRLDYRLAVVIVFISFLTLIITATRLATPVLFKQVNLLASDFHLITAEVAKLQPILDGITDVDLPLADIIPELESEINQILVPSRLFRMLKSATDNMVWIMVTLMTCFYLLLDHTVLIKWIYRITPPSLRENLGHILAEIDLVWKTYLLGQFSMMLFIGLLSGLGGVAVGLKNALLIGIIAGILEMIPSLGPAIATFIAGMTAWTQGSTTLDISNFWFTVIVCLIFILIQVFENTILIPRVMGRRMKLHPALVFVAIVSTLSLYGVLAGLIVIPLIGSIVVIINHSFQSLDQTAPDELPGESPQ